MKKTVFLLLIIFAVCGAVFLRTHRPRECKVISIVNNVATVEHPNGLHYKTNNNNYVKGQKYIFYFDELTDYEKDYTIVK